MHEGAGDDVLLGGQLAHPRAPATAPQKNPIWAAAATRPSSHRAPFSLMAKASMNDRKPTMPRIEPMADDAADDAGAAQLLLLGLARRLGGHGGGRQLQGQHGADAEDDGAEGRRSTRRRRA